MERYTVQDWQNIVAGLQLLLEERDQRIEALEDHVEGLTAGIKMVKESLRASQPTQPVEETRMETVSRFLDSRSVYSDQITALDFSIHYAQPAYRQLDMGNVHDLPRDPGSNAMLFPIDVLETALLALFEDEEAAREKESMRFESLGDSTQ